MKDVDFDGFGVDDDGTPIMAFDVEMADGRDLSGLVQYRIAAIRDDHGDPVVALVAPGDRILATLPWSTRLERWFDRAIDDGGYLGVTRYENMDWEDGGGHALAVLSGPNLDQHTERVDLDPDDVSALEQIRDLFTEKTNA